MLPLGAFCNTFDLHKGEHSAILIHIIGLQLLKTSFGSFLSGSFGQVLLVTVSPFLYCGGVQTGSVVECSTCDLGVTGSSLTRGTDWCP